MLELNQPNETLYQNTPQIIKIHADNNSKKQICIQWGSFFIITATFYFFTLAIPDALQYQSNSPCQLNQQFIDFANYDCRQASTNNYKKKAIQINNQLPSQLFMLLQVQLALVDSSLINSQENIIYQFSMWQIDQIDGTLVSKSQIYLPKNHSVLVKCYSIDQSTTLVCDSFSAAYLPSFDSGNYLVVVEIVSEQSSKIKSFDLEGISASQGFTLSIIIIRYTFLIFSLISGIIYIRRLYKLNYTHHVIEQKMIIVLSVLVIFFDDPLYAATVLIPNKVTSIIGVLFLSNFLVFLLMFWMVSIYRIVNENGLKTKAVDYQKIIICILLWFCMVTSYSILEMNFYYDPSSTYDAMNSSTFLAFKVMSFILAGLILVYVFWNYVRFCREYSGKLWRYKVHGLFALYFILCFAIFLYSGSFQLYQFDGARILLSIAIMNLYIYYLQYLWAPSAEGIRSQQIELRIEMQVQQNLVYDQLDDEGLKISFRDSESDGNEDIPGQKKDL